MTDKDLTDFLPDKNAEYFKEFHENNLNLKINELQIIEKIKDVMDPEIPVNIYDLGLIYNIKIDSNNNVFIEMTLTNPNCPVAGSMPESVGNSVSKITGLSSIRVKLVWYPKWTKEMMSEEAKLALDIY